MELVRGDSAVAFFNATKTFSSGSKPVAALGDITFSCKRGEFVSLVGPSGCGKSTVLRLAAGLEEPTSGQVTFEGNPVIGPSIEKGFVFQAYNTFPWLTVRQNVAFGLPDNGADHASEIDSWLHKMGLDEFSAAYPKTLSGGMRQRLAIARTMIMKPRLLLMDEPFGALDERTRTRMQELLLEVVSQSGCTVLFVTHDLHEALFLADRVCVLTPRPAKVRETLAVPFPKPRSREIVKTAQFIELHEQLVSNFPG
jgi:NitT/TauT family transport system ATP-binding protein